MNDLVLPVLVLEKETDDLNVLTSIAELRMMVEEFWDILNEDFSFWDAEGCQLTFEERFLKGDASGLTKSDCDAERVAKRILMYAERKDLPMPPDVQGKGLQRMYEQLAAVIR